MNEKGPKPEEKEIIIDHEYAQHYIEATKAEVASTGAVSNEIDRLNTLLRDLKEGNCSPQEAVEGADEIAKNRQDYH